MKTTSFGVSLARRIDDSLREDGAFADITTAALPGVRRHRLVGTLVAHQAGILSGIDVITAVFRRLDPRARIKIFKKNGATLRSSDRIARVEASATAILGGERVMINLVSHLSGVATLTGRFVKAVNSKSVAVLDTRKTIPLWRDLERAAVKDGGGQNHRFNLSDAILVKDNHVAYLKQKGIRAHAVYGQGARSARKKSPAFVAIEAKTHAEVWEAIKARPDIILLDNMAPDQLKGAILFIKAARRGLQTSTPYIEVSGGVTMEKAKQLAALGVDRISVGALTHSAPSLDMSLEVV